jgi:hemolysin activation/secretion protein
MTIRTRERARVCCQPKVTIASPARLAAGFAWLALHVAFLLLMLTCRSAGAWDSASAAGPGLSAVPLETIVTNALSPFPVTAYALKGDPELTKPAFTSNLVDWTGTNMTFKDVVAAAFELQHWYNAQGYTNVTITIGREEITNRIVTMNAFRGLVPQVVVDGQRCSAPPSRELAMAVSGTNAARANQPGAKNAVSTNAPRGFPVRGYEIRGETLLSMDTLTSIFTNYVGTNVTVEQIKTAASELQLEYRKRRYPTVTVTIPAQTLADGIVKIRVFQGRLSDIEVVGNRYFSSNNVMRALPSLHTNMILVDAVFQAELDQANANQDRQIYPELLPGETENATVLNLKVKDRLPLHAKVDFNNESSPDTPALRVNTSMVYNNLWQYEHSLGVQYSFSPEQYKSGDQWNFYDLPLVANYSGFYRLPLAEPTAVADEVASQPGSFGFSEATRRFNLPPPSGVPELNLYASRSTIDTGLQTSDFRSIVNTPSLSITAYNEQQDITINQSMGFRLSLPVPQFEGIRSTFSGGFDYKEYENTTDKSYVYNFSQAIPTGGGLTNYLTTTYSSPVPTVNQVVRYAPLSLRWDGSRPDSTGTTAFGIGYSPNFSDALFNNNEEYFQHVTGSSQANGYFQIVTASLSRQQEVFTNWWLSVRADGQWANQPLVSNEQYGVGGVNSVRGYHEGEVFGDTGWHISLEPQTPSQFIGMVYRNHPLRVRGSVYMGYGETYLLDPQGRTAHTSLWGTGLGAVVSIGATWEGRFLFSWPLLSAGTVSAYEPLFNFSLSAQF